jgi:hypothetical protein
MAAFGVGTTVVTSVPFVDVDGLMAGTYRFRLEVEDAAGILSNPVEMLVVVTPPPPPPPPPPVTRPPITRQPIDIDPIDRESRIPIYKRPGGGRMQDF